jgi:undecaprenyl-diphosphatase
MWMPLLPWLEAAFLGLLQGLTEFLPVSSSAHLRIAGAFLPSGVDPGAAFTAITQIGTEAAVLLYFRRDIWHIGVSWLSAGCAAKRVSFNAAIPPTLGHQATGA